MSKKAAKRAAKIAAADAAYRKALGVSSGDKLPGTIGQAQSGGAGRGGRGAASKGRGKNS